MNRTADVTAHQFSTGTEKCNKITATYGNAPVNTHTGAGSDRKDII